MNHAKRRETFDVFVGNIPPHASEVTIGQLFSCFGEIDRIRVMEPKRDGGAKIAFVNFLCEPDAERAIRERSNYVYCGHPLNTSRATSWKDRREKSGHQGPFQKQPYLPACSSRLDGNNQPFPPNRKFLSDPGPPSYQKQQQMHSSSMSREEQFVLTQVESPVTFFAHLLRQNQDHLELSRNLAEICPRQTQLTGKPLPNKVYAAKFSEDDQWYRCKVPQVDYYDKSYIHYIDYGNWELMPHKQMVSLPHNLATLPPLALRCHLRNLRPVDRETFPATFREGIMFMQSQLQERIIVATLTPRSDGSFDIARLVLGDVDVHHHLLRYGYAFSGSGGPLPSKPQIGFSTDLPKRILDRSPADRPPLERVSSNGDAGWPGRNDEGFLQRKVDELEMQLSQEKGKVKAVTAQFKRLSEQTKVSDPYEKLEAILEDVKRVCLLRKKIPILPGEPDYLEDAFKLSMDLPLEEDATVDTPRNSITVIERVLDGINEVYGDLLKTRSYNNDSFPIQELVAYYRRLRQTRKSKCVPLGAETDAARTALASASVSLSQALVSGEAFPCHFDKALEKLRRCLSQELAARALESSDVAVLAVMSSLLQATLSRKLKEEGDLVDLAEKLKNMPKAQEEEAPPTILAAPQIVTEATSNDQILHMDDEEDSEEEEGCGADDLSSLRQKICSLPIVAGRN